MYLQTEKVRQSIWCRVMLSQFLRHCSFHSVAIPQCRCCCWVVALKFLVVQHDVCLNDCDDMICRQVAWKIIDCFLVKDSLWHPTSCRILLWLWWSCRQWTDGCGEPSYVSSRILLSCWHELFIRTSMPKGNVQRYWRIDIWRFMHWLWQRYRA